MARKNRNAIRRGRKQMHPTGCGCKYCRAKRAKRS